MFARHRSHRGENLNYSFAFAADPNSANILMPVVAPLSSPSTMFPLEIYLNGAYCAGEAFGLGHAATDVCPQKV
jgi:hypothetical protein